MCEPLMPITMLKNIRFSLSALAELTPPGSYQREQIGLMCKGIRDNLDWCIANLERAGEGQRNFGIEKYPADKVPGGGG